MSSSISEEDFEPIISINKTQSPILPLNFDPQLNRGDGRSESDNYSVHTRALSYLRTSDPKLHNQKEVDFVKHLKRSVLMIIRVDLVCPLHTNLFSLRSHCDPN